MIKLSNHESNGLSKSMKCIDGEESKGLITKPRTPSKLRKLLTNLIFMMFSVFVIAFWRGVWLLLDELNVKPWISIVIGLCGVIVFGFIYYIFTDSKSITGQIASSPLEFVKPQRR
eukprot:257895_1